MSDLRLARASLRQALLDTTNSIAGPLLVEGYTVDEIVSKARDIISTVQEQFPDLKEFDSECWKCQTKK